jgi:hypothetical protein
MDLDEYEYEKFVAEKKKFSFDNPPPAEKTLYMLNENLVQYETRWRYSARLQWIQVGLLALILWRLW